MERVEGSVATYYHQITKTIEDELPGIENNDLIGPFSYGDESCKNFEWLVD